MTFSTFVQNKWVHVALVAISAALAAGLPAAGLPVPEWASMILGALAGGATTHALTTQTTTTTSKV